MIQDIDRNDRLPVGRGPLVLPFPEHREPVLQRLHSIRAQAVPTPLAIDPNIDQPSFSQASQMLGDRWLRRFEIFNELVDAPFAFAHQLEDLPLGRIPYDTKHIQVSFPRRHSETTPRWP